MLWALGAPIVLIIRTAGARAADSELEDGVEGAREMIAPPGRVSAAEPGRMVTGVPPVDGVKMMDEASGSRVMGELPMVAMTGAGAGAATGFGTEDGGELRLGKSWMVVAGLAGCPSLTMPVGATKSWVPLVASERMELETMIAGPPGANVWLLMI
jgi:hypothetical protein